MQYRVKGEADQEQNEETKEPTTNGDAKPNTARDGNKKRNNKK